MVINLYNVKDWNVLTSLHRVRVKAFRRLYFSFSPLRPAHIRMLTFLLDSRVNIFHNNDSKAIISLQRQTP